MYQNALENLRNLADQIREGEYQQPELTEASMGIMERPKRPKKDDEDDTPTFEEMMLETMAYLKGLEKTNPQPEETPEVVRPKGRFEVPKGEIQDTVYQGLIERGLPEHVAKGFMLNFQDESGFKVDVEEYEPNVHGTRGKGLYQLTGDRREAFERMFGGDYSIDNQLDFLVYELENTEKSAFEKILNTSTPGEAGVAIVKSFLRPAKKHQESRANKYLNSTGYAL